MRRSGWVACWALQPSLRRAAEESLTATCFDLLPNGVTLGQRGVEVYTQAVQQSTLASHAATDYAREVRAELKAGVALAGAAEKGSTPSNGDRLEPRSFIHRDVGSRNLGESRLYAFVRDADTRVARNESLPQSFDSWARELEPRMPLTDFVYRVGVAPVKERLMTLNHSSFQPRPPSFRIFRHLVVSELESGNFSVLNRLENLSFLSAKQPLVVVDVRCEYQIVPSGCSTLRTLPAMEVADVTKCFISALVGQLQVFTTRRRYSPHHEVECLEVILSADLGIEEEE